MLKNATKDIQTADASGKLKKSLIEGVRQHTITNITTRNGVTTELFRPEWPVGPEQVRHMIHVQFRAGVIAAWHMHEEQTDTFFVLNGAIKLALFDDREGSSTRGDVNVFHLSRLSPELITIPPGIWHGLQNLDNTESGFINYFDKPYNYENPDEWRVPQDHDQIPYRFE